MKKLVFVALVSLILAACGDTPQACTDMLKSYDELIMQADHADLKEQFKQQRAIVEKSLKSAGAAAETQCVKVNEGFEQMKKLMESTVSKITTTPDAPIGSDVSAE